MKEYQVVNANEMKELDQLTLKEKGITSYELLEHAGKRIFEYITRNSLYSEEDKILIVSGIGNNGGDSLIVAHELSKKSMEPCIVVIGEKNRQSEENKKALDKLIKRNLKINFISSSEDILLLENLISQITLVIDGIFGIGLTREVAGYYKEVINLINESNKKVISIDVPSGLNSDNGIVQGIAVNARDTIIVQNYKQGNILNDAQDYSGNLHLLDIGISQKVFSESQLLLKESFLDNMLPKRKKNSHKYHYGSVLTIGGSKGMMGAPLLASYTALRTGSGLSSITYNEKYIDYIYNIYPEIMVNTFSGIEELKEQTHKKSSIIFGPGLGRNDNLNIEILRYLLSTDIPLVIDADGIYYLKEVIDDFKDRGNIIITPHNKEMSDFIDVEINSVIENPLLYARDTAQKYNLTVILKGTCTIITNCNETFFSIYGNPGMATAGSGDVLSGIVGSLLGRGLTLLEAATTGVLIHSKAGEYAKDILGEEYLIATDLIRYISNVLKNMQNS